MEILTNFLQKKSIAYIWELDGQGNDRGTGLRKQNLSNRGTVDYGETGNVILRGTFTNVNGEKALAAQFTLNVRQKPVLDTLKLEQKDADATLKNGENAYVSDILS